MPRPILPRGRTAVALRGLVRILPLLLAASLARAQGEAPAWPLRPVGWEPLLQEPVEASDRPPGAPFPIEIVMRPAAEARLAQPDRARWAQTLREMLGFLSGAPVLVRPAGFHPSLYGWTGVVTADPWVQRPQTAPMAGGVGMRPWAPEQVRFDAQGRPARPIGESSSLRISLNFLPRLDAAAWMRDAAGEFGALVVQGTHAGYPIVDNALLLTRDGEFPYLPVTVGRALEAFVAHYAGEEARVQREIEAARGKLAAWQEPAAVAQRRARIDAELAKVSDPSRRERARRDLERWERSDEEQLRARAEPELERAPGYATLRSVRAARLALQSMPPEALAAPCWIDPARQHGEIVLVQSGAGLPLMAIDPGFFRSGAPRSTVRVAAVQELHVFAEGARRLRGQPGGLAYRANLQLFQQTDWRAFAQRFLQPR